MVQAIKCEMSFFLLLFTSLWKWWTNEVNNNSASRSPWLPRLWDPKFRILSNLAMGRTNLSGLFLSFQAFHSCPTNLLGASLNGTNLFQKDIHFDIPFKSFVLSLSNMQVSFFGHFLKLYSLSAIYEYM